VTDELRAYFESSARQRLADLDLLLPRAAHDREALQTVARHFHAFAGLGGTYGYARISELGDAAEEVLVPLLRSERMPDADLIASLQRIAADIEGILPRPCGPPDAS
jgi:chemotaxis protein histidine kinase CheA